MENALEKAVRALIPEEINESERKWTSSTPVARPVIEMPLCTGEVERHYPVAEVARLLGMSRDWVYDRIEDGTFTVANFGAGKSKRRIPASSINAYIEANTYSMR